MIQKFNIESLASIDNGMLRAAFEAAVKRAREDCTDRPGVKEARKVVLTMTIEPCSDDDAGSADSVDVRFFVEEKLPKRGGRKTNMLCGRGGMAYNDGSPDDVDQLTFGDLGPRDESGIARAEQSVRGVANAQ